MFKIIDDKQVADELWVARVLWWRYRGEGDLCWRLDDTQDTNGCVPSRTWEVCDHAIRVEE